ncbi:MAG: 30S ribosomal protein S16 [Bdellovibrionaceae bacterium]|nr:30S ribosomal protein S16 [Bdellovibrionales bacterium]MCB9254714.1 30S ribosomal protein S16 [Pseudobdellovibrionaceae bacterium]
MATVIRFARHGTKKKPYFRIVVQDSRQKRDGRFIEHIGAFNPIKGSDSLVISKPRLEYWLNTGAQLSTSVKNRLRTTLKNLTGAPSAEKAAAPQDQP